jgi:hypothetical protein
MRWLCFQKDLEHMFPKRTWALLEESSLFLKEVAFFLEELLLFLVNVSFWGTYLLP